MVTKAARMKEMKEEMNVKSDIKLTESKIQIKRQREKFTHKSWWDVRSKKKTREREKRDKERQKDRKTDIEKKIGMEIVESHFRWQQRFGNFWELFRNIGSLNNRTFK